MKIITLLFIAALVSIEGHAVETGSPRPNIIFILADDLGYGDVQALNPERGKVATPHLDKLASQGMVFTDAHSGSSVCTPTRYGLLTGRYSWRTRLQKGVLDGGNDEPLISAERLTVGRFLQQHGYQTACIGKWHLGFQSEAAPRAAKSKQMGSGGLPLAAQIIGGPTTRGFDLFWGCSNARTMSSVIEGDHVAEILPPIEILPRLTQRAVEYLSAPPQQPFFLYLPLTSPHTPILPSPEWQGKSGVGAYGDFVMQTDACVGQILTALDTAHLAENTLVIFSSDNGCSPQAGTTELEKQGHYASANYRGYKSDIWDGGHRVPFLARWPGTITPGSQSQAVICLGDFMATVADLLKVELPAEAAPDSISFLPNLKDPSLPGRDALVHHSINGQFAVRQGRWKLDLCPGSGGWGHPTDKAAAKKAAPSVQLYDIESDPGEETNLVSQYPEKVTQLTRLLETYITQGRSTPGSPQANDVEVKRPWLSR
ncbi:Arylsulfatase A [Prosthecobacter debontii]|uniref:Arylsulfatase A n=1 Tax=Prosthecobacter debontii TaxID=48467 RepID=A0A1T4YNF8_9BACT|nr:arylsulfatase [Prosthecobacter debontii]SKB03098.1 Arylsulfatase A [Prosthecobacter debontii]